MEVIARRQSSCTYCVQVVDSHLCLYLYQGPTLAPTAFGHTPAVYTFRALVLRLASQMYTIGSNLQRQRSKEGKLISTKPKHVRPFSGTAVYPHMPILHTCRVVESPTGTFIVLHALADSSDFGLLGEQRSPKCEISCPGR